MECVVCGTVLAKRPPTTPAAPYPICHAVPCRMVIEQAGSMSPVAFQQHLLWRSRNIRVQKARAHAEDRRLKAKFDAEAQENTLWWARLERLAPGQHPPDRFLPLTLPAGPGLSGHLAQRRRRRYRDLLNRLIAQAVASQDPPPDLGEHLATHAPASPLTGQVCAACKGGCCTSGGDSAYLSVNTIRRFMALRPALRPREVLAAYLDRLGTRTQQGSCINHTSQGCGLPREMRSDVCNHYLCGTQKELQSRLEDPPPLLGVVVIQRQQDHWHRHDPDRPNPIVGGITVTEADITPWPEAP
ncbi:MAG: hypothetical protein EOP36_17325 [Rubrivivax sp.]|nr:MAG: hypothetical protein EOP36_17325 [Rubrivivax sp.]